MSKAPDLTPVEVNLLTAADETAEGHKAAVTQAVVRAQNAMQFDQVARVREHLTYALAELDGLEARLTEIRGRR